MGLGRTSVIVVRPVGELSDLAVVLAVSPDLVHHVVRQHVKYVSNGGYGRASPGLSLDIVGQGREQGGEQSHHDPQGGGSAVRRHRRDQAQVKG